ncbi:type VI secretion system tip protein VgrG [Candidatus Fukatsuia endosymbiont of Tuberolachnus salignus]|uniref:type VI secretion system tip protein VgrG n=1 Tax=Candidatus Fukatsuia endosymbiont of Tuberolachnus salignus TaxID=3077957 RepID=UPI00313EAB9F
MMKGVYTITLSCQGKKLTSLQRHIVALEVILTVNKIPTAQLVIAERGPPAEQPFHLSPGDFFKPGHRVDIHLRYEDEPKNEKLIFSGIVVKHKIAWHDDHGSRLSLDLKSQAIRLTTRRKSVLFEKTTDKDIITRLIKQGGLTLKGAIGKAEVKHPQMVQYHCSDWDFILARATANGLWVLFHYLEGKEHIQIVAPDFKQSPKQVFNVNNVDPQIVIHNVELEVDIRQQLNKVRAAHWDTKKLALTWVDAQQTSVKQGTVDAVQAAQTIGADPYPLVHLGGVAPEELQACSKAMLDQARLTLLRGRFQIKGRKNITLGECIAIKGVGSYFEGHAIVTGIRHQLNREGWQTHVQVGLTEGMSRSFEMCDPAAAGLLPAIQGLHVGIVVGHAKEQNPQFCLKVHLPLLEDKNKVLWARLASPYASDKKGLVFRPEVGDEVVLGFFNNDPRYPVILGAMHSEKNPPPLAMEKDNHQKGIVTQENMQFLMDDKEKTLKWMTAKNNSVTLVSGKKSGIYLKDQHNNQVNLTEQGIDIKLDKNLTADTGQNVVIKGKKIDFK